MDSLEISLARAYLAASEHDPVTALIRSVKDLARLSRLLRDVAQPEAAEVPGWAGAETPRIASGYYAAAFAS